MPSATALHTPEIYLPDSPLPLLTLRSVSLRHDDDLELLKPAHTGLESGYRYYAVDQLPRLHRILALKELGFSLEHITQLLRAEVSAEQMRDNLGCLDLTLTPDHMRQLDEASGFRRGFPVDSLEDEEVTELIFGGTRPLIDTHRRYR